MKRTFILIAKALTIIAVASGVYYFLGDPLAPEKVPTVSARLDSSKCPDQSEPVAVTISNDSAKTIDYSELVISYAEKDYSNIRGFPDLFSTDRIIPSGQSFTLCREISILSDLKDRSRLEIYPRFVNIVYAQ